MNAVLERPTKNEQIVAQQNLSQIDRLTASFTDLEQSVNVQVNNKEVIKLKLPAKVFRVLKSILNLMAEGIAFSVIPEESELSTKQAADFLNVSRPHFVKLLEEGKMPFKKVGTHRRVLLVDLLAYAKILAEKRENALKELAIEAQDLGLGY